MRAFERYAVDNQAGVDAVTRRERHHVSNALRGPAPLLAERHGTAARHDPWNCRAARCCHDGSHQVLRALIVRISDGDADSRRAVAVQRGANGVNGNRAGQTLSMTGTRNRPGIIKGKGAHGVITDFYSKNHRAGGAIVSPVQSTWT